MNIVELIVRLVRRTFAVNVTRRSLSLSLSLSLKYLEFYHISWTWRCCVDRLHHRIWRICEAVSLIYDHVYI